MFLFANFLSATAGVLSLILTAYMWIIIARAIVSWVSADPHNPIVRFLYNATEPLLYRVRRALPVFAGGIDFSPLLVIAVIYFLQAFLVRSLYDVAARLAAVG
jgi:YggT family protein